MWIWGNSGLGKTTLAKKISSEMYGEENPYMKP